MRVGGLGGAYKAGLRNTKLCKHFAMEGLGRMWQKEFCFIPIAVRSFETIAIHTNIAKYSGKETIKGRFLFNMAFDTKQTCPPAVWDPHVTLAQCGYRLLSLKYL